MQGVFDDIQKKAVEFYKTSSGAMSKSQDAEGGAAAPMSEAAKTLETKLEVRARAPPTPHCCCRMNKKEKRTTAWTLFGSVRVTFGSCALYGTAWARVGWICTMF